VHQGSGNCTTPPLAVHLKESRIFFISKRQEFQLRTLIQVEFDIEKKFDPRRHTLGFWGAAIQTGWPSSCACIQCQPTGTRMEDTWKYFWGVLRMSDNCDLSCGTNESLRLLFSCILACCEQRTAGLISMAIGAEEHSSGVTRCAIWEGTWVICVEHESIELS
jgi:hypothetical protein